MTRRTVLVEIVQPRKTPVERILSLSAIAISVTSLFLSLWQARQTVQHNKFSVTSNLTLHRIASREDSRVALVLASTGLGPAIVKKTQILLDGVPVPDWEAVSSKTSTIWKVKTPSWYMIHPGDYFMPVNTKLELYGTQNENISDFTAFRRLVYDRLSVKITHCSIYDECNEACLGSKSGCVHGDAKAAR